MSEKHRVRLTLDYVGPEPAFIAALKAALKVLGRSFNFRCVTVSLESPALPPEKDTRDDLLDGD